MRVILISGGAIQVKGTDGEMVHCEPGVMVDILDEEYEKFKTRFIKWQRTPIAKKESQ